MIDPAYVSTMARYNAWQNRSMIGAADTLDDGQRKQDRGAFFKSIHATFSHVLWADEVWLHRLIGTPKPPAGGRDSAAYLPDWAEFRQKRAEIDGGLEAWAETVQADWLRGNLVWFSGAAGHEMTKPRGVTISHLFNHQTHHRGQIHAMLTAAGARPDDTDLFLLDELR